MTKNTRYIFWSCLMMIAIAYFTWELEVWTFVTVLGTVLAFGKNCYEQGANSKT